MRHNPVKDLELLHSDFVVVSGMINTVIEAARNGECTPTDIGNSLFALKEVMDKRVELLVEKNRKLHELSILYEDAISDKEILKIFEECKGTTGEGGKIQEETDAAYDRVFRFMELLPEDQEKSAWISVREAEAASRRQGFLDGFKKVYKIMIELEEVHG